MRKTLFTAGLLALSCLSPVMAADAVKSYPIDPESGLIMAPGWEMVNYQCNACHTTSIIPQNKGNREVWRDTIQWMVDTQGLWDLSDTWDPVLDYLSTYYDETGIDMKIFRRKPLDSEQMPPMPTSNEEN